MADNEERIIDPEIEAEWADNSTESLINAINEAEAEETEKKKKTKKIRKKTVVLTTIILQHRQKGMKMALILEVRPVRESSLRNIV